MDPIKLSEGYFVLPQISVSDLDGYASLGFDVVVNNRPDNESEGQPLSKDLEQKAIELGLRYVYNPVNLSELSQHQLDMQNDAVSSASKVLAFCRTGTRSSVLWVLNNQSVRSFDVLVNEVSNKGFDLARCMPAMAPFKSS